MFLSLTKLLKSIIDIILNIKQSQSEPKSIFEPKTVVLMYKTESSWGHSWCLGNFKNLDLDLPVINCAMLDRSFALPGIYVSCLEVRG